jgi:uncharacterized damage-inducible protein DinB
MRKVVSMPSIFPRLFSHLGWADQAVIAAMRQTPTPNQEWLELFGHVLGSEHVWFARIEGRTPELAVWPALSIEECAAVAQANLQNYQLLAEQADAVRLGTMIHYRNSAGREFDSTVEDILLHVCLHGSYHRGQIARAMRQGGAVPAPTDYIGYIRGAPAATRQA